MAGKIQGAQRMTSENPWKVCAEMVTPKRHHKCATIESENNSM